MLRLRKILLLNKIYIILLILVLLYSIIITKVIKHESIYNGKENYFETKIIKFKIDGNKLSLELKGKEKLIGNYYIKTEEEKKYLLKKLEFGKTILVNGTLKEPANNTVPFQFNYKKYLNNQKIYYILNIDNLEISDKKLNMFYKLKNYMYKHANDYDNNSYIYAFILGSTERIDTEVLESYRSNGISHLFALSGLHVSIISLIIIKIIEKFKVKELLRYTICFLILLLFAFISGFSPSILRASLLFILLGINKVFYFNIETKNILYLTFDILVLINPFIIYNLGFILSFTITFFLIISTNILKDKNYFKTLFKTSLLSFIASLMLNIYYFGYLNPLGIIINLIFVPLVSFIIFPLTIITYIFPYLSILLNISTKFMEFLSLTLDKFALKIYFPNLNIIVVIIYYIFLYLSIINKKIKYLILILLLVIYIYIKPYFDRNSYVYFIDVGQGDSILLVTPYKDQTILIDTGGNISYEVEEWKKRKEEYSIGKDTIIALMRKIGIKKIDYLILTHGDYDHMGEAINLIENFKVDKVIFNCGEFNGLEQDLIKVLDKKKIPYYSCIKQLNIDDNKLYFLNNKDYGNENDNSSVIYTELNNHKFLFMGDAGIEVEEGLIEKYNLNDIDVLKVGHHGSKTSSSENFINEISPKYSIISVGKNNRYGHPNKEVLSNLEQSKIYRTDQDGSIMFKIKNKKLKIETCSP